MTDPDRATLVLSAFKALGVHLSIDDFGVGYSSMAQLNRLPVDELKIDRSFVSQMRDHEQDDVLVRSSIELGHSLGLAVVAEGVEDQDTLDLLTRLGCDVVQGYHLARPMDARDMVAWLATRTATPTPTPTPTATPPHPHRDPDRSGRAPVS